MCLKKKKECAGVLCQQISHVYFLRLLEENDLSAVGYLVKEEG